MTSPLVELIQDMTKVVDEAVDAYDERAPQLISALVRGNLTSIDQVLQAERTAYPTWQDAAAALLDAHDVPGGQRDRVLTYRALAARALLNVVACYTRELRAAVAADRDARWATRIA